MADAMSSTKVLIAISSLNKRQEHHDRNSDHPEVVDSLPEPARHFIGFLVAFHGAKPDQRGGNNVHQKLIVETAHELATLGVARIAPLAFEFGYFDEDGRRSLRAILRRLHFQELQALCIDKLDSVIHSTFPCQQHSRAKLSCWHGCMVLT